MRAHGEIFKPTGPHGSNSYNNNTNNTNNKRNPRLKAKRNLPLSTLRNIKQFFYN
jgi:ribosome assembly protein YihI (activator of Der GTPase)